MASQNPANEINFFYKDSPPRALVYPLLHGEMNYITWSRKMKQVLLSKNMWFVIDGNPSFPLEEGLANGLWQRSNNKVLGWIRYSTEEPIRQTILCFDRASEAWKNLHRRFCQPDMTRIFYLQEQIFRGNQGSLTLQQYYTRFMRSWDEMESLRPSIIACLCSTPCTCGAVQTCKIYRDQDCVLHFLKGLNEKFAPVIHHILNSVPLPPIHDVVLLVSQNEQLVTGDLSSVSESSVSNADQPDRSGRGGGGNEFIGDRSCTYCGKSNHTVTSCYYKHGFPPGYRTNNHNNASSANADEGPMPQTTAPLTVVGFTQEQYEGLSNLLQQAGQRSPTPSLSDFHISNPVQSSSYNTASDSSL